MYQTLGRGFGLNDDLGSLGPRLTSFASSFVRSSCGDIISHIMSTNKIVPTSPQIIPIR